MNLISPRERASQKASEKVPFVSSCYAIDDKWRHTAQLSYWRHMTSMTSQDGTHETFSDAFCDAISRGEIRFVLSALVPEIRFWCYMNYQNKVQNLEKSKSVGESKYFKYIFHGQLLYMKWSIWTQRRIWMAKRPDFCKILLVGFIPIENTCKIEGSGIQNPSRTRPSFLHHRIQRVEKGKKSNIWFSGPAVKPIPPYRYTVSSVSCTYIC